MKILLVEDDNAIAEVVTLILEGEGHTVVKILDEKRILTHVRASPPDLILMDLSLGGKNGELLIKKLKNNSQTQLLPVIITSASHDGAAAVKRTGADGFLLKPFEIEQLFKVVQKYQK
ncbi:MAG TPA: response regulator [Patescibacteria group bacterium]|nr:response regulator [Patescibacteria group bacterium]